MPPDASDFPGGIPAIDCSVTRSEPVHFNRSGAELTPDRSSPGGVALSCVVGVRSSLLRSRPNGYPG